MLKESGAGGSRRLSESIVPWLAGAALLLLYLLTLHPWVSPESLRTAADATGLNWRIDLLGSVSWLAAFPIRCLPAGWIPPALNAFAAVCAALSLVLLARSVTLLARVEEKSTESGQAMRADNEQAAGSSAAGESSLSWREALPPVLAVAVCGLQSTFWENATLAGGAMFHILLFAGAVWYLLEFRTRRKGSWMLGCAALYGLAVADDWAMAACAPLFFLAAVWAARLNPFDEHFPGRLHRLTQTWSVRRMVLVPACFLAGLSFAALLPVFEGGLEQGLGGAWRALWLVARAYRHFLFGLPPATGLALSLTIALPILFVALCSAEEVGNSRIKVVGPSAFRLMHLFFLVIGLCVALDFPLSPRGLGVGYACLPIYWLSALGAGYFSDCCLRFSLIRPTPVPHFLAPTQRRIQLALRRFERVVQCGLAIAPWVALAVMPVVLGCKNLPLIAQNRHGAFESYNAQLARSLPAPGSVIFSADSFRLSCLETLLLRRGRQGEYLTIDTTLLSEEPAYFDFVRKRHPGIPLAMPGSHTPAELTNRAVFVDLVRALSTQRPVFFLHPVYGLLGETFIAQPQGLFWELRPAPANSAETPRLSAEALAQNKSFWEGVPAAELSMLAAARRPALPPASEKWKRLFKAAIVPAESDRWAELAGASFSAALTSWGVELQRVGRFAEAGACFEQARQLNPDNAAARINLEFNRLRQAGRPAILQPEDQADNLLGKRRSWEEVLNVDGLVDEPNACFRLGNRLAEMRLRRQALREFERAQALAPNFTNAIVQQAEQFLWLADYTNCLISAGRALALDPAHPLALYHKGYALFILGHADQAIPPLTLLLTQQPGNHDALMLRALAFLQSGRIDAACRDYESAAAVMPDPTSASLSLIEIANRLNDTNTAAKYARQYLAQSPTNQAGIRKVQDYLEKLRKLQPTK
jgi:tetratricopeptide (TPR) repeat protein